MNNKLIKIVLSFLIAIGLSVFLYQYLIYLFGGYEINEGIENQIKSEFNLKLYTLCVLMLTSLISLPFIFSFFATKWEVQRKRLSWIVLILELVGFFAAYFLTPPDAISTLIIFVVWQLPVAVNSIVLISSLEKSEREERNSKE